MKKIVFCLATVAILAAPTLASADSKGMNGLNVLGNQNYSNGDIDNSVSIAEGILPETEFCGCYGELPGITILSTNNAGHSAAQSTLTSGLSLYIGANPSDVEVPEQVGTVGENITVDFANVGASGSVSDSTVGNNNTEGAGAGNLEAIIDLFDDFQISQYDDEGDFDGSWRIERTAALYN